MKFQILKAKQKNQINLDSVTTSALEMVVVQLNRPRLNDSLQTKRKTPLSQ